MVRNLFICLSVSLFLCFTSCDKQLPPATEDTEKPDTPDQPDTPDKPDTPDQPDTPEVNDGKGVILIVGGGASGCCAAIQAARMGMEAILVEESPWLGGMLTAAGVTATDGCYNLRSGLFKEFTDRLATHYGGYNALKTGWVSNILFEPHIGEQIFEDLCAAENELTIVKNAKFASLVKNANGWSVTFDKNDGSTLNYDCDILIDATELGDVAKAAGVRYRIGMDSSAETGEAAAIGPNDVVQDMTMVMTLKKYDRDMTIAKPENYDESLYVNCCKNSLNTPSDKGQALWSAEQMMSYGKCPGGKYMINWPISGNDYYANIIDLPDDERDAYIEKAKQVSLGFLYFMQTRLGYKNFYLADDEYPSEDLFPFYPYHRESRRIHGEHLFTVDEASSTFSTDAYRTGVAVGDYPVDHHHYAHPDWQSYKIDFPKIVPFSVPLGCMIPLEVENLIVADKSISVSNLINGSTRLQPVVMELGQAAGALAVIALKHAKPVRESDIREVQQALLSAGALLMPYKDCLAGDRDFQAIQRIGLTGILRGQGQTVGWSNECTFRPDAQLKWSELYLEDYFGEPYNASESTISREEFRSLLEKLKGEAIADFPTSGANSISRREAARLIDKYLNPFNEKKVDWNGKI